MNQKILRDLYEELRPWNELRAKVTMTIPVDYVLLDCNLAPERLCYALAIFRLNA